MHRTNARQLATENTNSTNTGGAIRMKPCPLMSDEKLETPNGIMNSLKVCHGSKVLAALLPTLSNKAKPMTTLIPKEFSHIARLESK